MRPEDDVWPVEVTPDPRAAVQMVARTTPARRSSEMGPEIRARLGLVATRDGGVPLLSGVYAGNRTDVTQFTPMVEELVRRYATAVDRPGGVTLTFDAGQNSEPNFTLLAKLKLRFVGSVPPSDHPALLALPASDRYRLQELSPQKRKEEIMAVLSALATHTPPSVQSLNDAIPVALEFRLRGYHPLWPAFPGRSTTLALSRAATAVATGWSYNFGRGGQALHRQSGGEKQRAFSVRCIRD